MRKNSPLQTRIAAKQVSPLGVAAFLALVALAVLLSVGLASAGQPDWLSAVVMVVTIVPGVYILFALRMANEWEKSVVLRAGKFRGLRGPGMFWVVPVLDTIPVWIDHRVMVTPFNAEKTLTKEAT